MSSDTPHSETALSRFSTPVPELDDHRFQEESQPQVLHVGAGSFATQHTAASISPLNHESVDRSDLRPVRDAAREIAFVPRDFEHAVVDDDHSVREGPFGRRLSVDPSHQRRRRRSRAQQDATPRSRDSSPSDRSSSPPNSVDAFADPRRRERANTLESHAPSDLEAMIQRTVSGGSVARHPTFSNASAIRPQGDSRVDVDESPGVLNFEEPGRIPVIDYEELEEFVALSHQTRRTGDRRKHSLSSQSPRPGVFRQKGTGIPNIVVYPNVDQPSTDEFVEKVEHLNASQMDEKEILAALPNANDPTRFSFFSSECQTTVHAAELGDLILPGDTFRDLFQLGPDGGVWWLDVVNPTEAEVGALSRAFSIHPLTTEDIMTQEAREKVELFKQYYFVCFRTFFQVDKLSDRFLEPVHVYMVVYRDGVLSFSFTENPHASNVRRRIGKLRDYVALSSDWICYAMIDDIVDSFGPIIREVEEESEAIEDHVFVARVDDFETFLPRIGDLRKKVMSLMRLLGGKADVIKGFSKRCNEQYSVTPRGDIGLYLGDIQDHVVTMMSNLGHFEKMLSRSHSNYLAQLNVNNLALGNRVNTLLSKVTLIASLLVPMNLICGLWGMNVPVPGRNTESLGWFFGIVGTIFTLIIVCAIIVRRYKLL